MRRGEVWWYERPDRKPRPVLVLARDEAVAKLHKIIAVPSTGTARGLETEVPLDREDGMPRECVLSLDNTFSVRKALLTRYVTTLGPARMDEICRALTRATGC